MPLLSHITDAPHIYSLISTSKVSDSAGDSGKLTDSFKWDQEIGQEVQGITL